jgi:quinol-cytochrome oxidoreductase complex cytochrome b subunit
MMELHKFLDKYHEFSAKASEVNRQLAFAGFAVMWLFGGNVQHQPVLSHEFVLPGILLTGALALDLLQYVTGAIIWKVFHRLHERRGEKQTRDVSAPLAPSYILAAFFVTKILLVIFAYILILEQLGGRI